MSGRIVIVAKKFVLDSSVAVKWFSSDKESFWGKAKDFFDDLQAGKLTVFSPELSLLEIANALLLGKKINVGAVKEACGLLRGLRIQFPPLSTSLLDEAILLSAGNKLTVYDALYLALAKQQKCQVITADEKMASVKKYSLFISQYR